MLSGLFHLRVPPLPLRKCWQSIGGILRSNNVQRSSFREWCSAHSVRDVGSVAHGSRDLSMHKNYKILYCFLVKNIGFLEKVSFKSILDPFISGPKHIFLQKTWKSITVFPLKIQVIMIFSKKKHVFKIP